MPTKFERIFHLARAYMRNEGITAAPAIRKALDWIESNPLRHPTENEIRLARWPYRMVRGANGKN